MSAAAVRLERDRHAGGTRVFIPHEQEDLIYIRRERAVSPHFTAFVQLSLDGWCRPLFELAAAELGVWLALVIAMDREGTAETTTAEIATRTGLRPEVVSRAQTALWRRDLVRPLGRTRAGRRWMLSPHLVYRGPARASEATMLRWAALPRSDDPATSSED